MAATERAGAILAAALALPGLAPPVRAEGAPVSNVIGVKWLSYQDSQPGLQRLGVKAPSVYGTVRLGPAWSVDGSMVTDTVSGASPRWHSSVSGASRMSDQRHAGEVTVRHYQARSSWSIGASRSQENDYISNGLSGEASFSSEDNNTTWTVGLAMARDRIDPTGGGFLGTVANERKRTVQALVGWTRAVSPFDIVQLNATVNASEGYLSDPYKAFDNRPSTRQQLAVLARWNHWLGADGPTGSALRTSLRGYGDNWGVVGLTAGLEWAQPLGERLTLTPSMRYTTQSSASFYRDALADPTTLPIPAGYDPSNPPEISYDHRLSAFGAITYGLKAEVSLPEGWSFDAKAEAYQQRAAWRIGGPGSPGLDPFRATFFQLGASRRF